MLRFYADDFITIIDSLFELEQGIKGLSWENDGAKTLERILQRIEKACEAIRLTVSCVLLRRTIKTLQANMYVNIHMRGQILKDLSELRSRIKDELSERYFLFVFPDKVQYLESRQPFGEAVIEQFPNAIFDIEEASKCLAVQRPTACVFHFMRAMEEGLKALAKLLGIPYAPSWESYIRQIADKISQKHKRKGVHWKKDEPFFKEILGNLEAIKMSWRNPTMHIVRRYDVEEAEQIFVTVRLFIQRLAKKLS